MVKRRSRKDQHGANSHGDSEQSEQDESPNRRPRAFRFQSFKLKNAVETWAEYKRRLGQALEHQGFKTGAQKKQALLTCSDPELYRLMVALCYPKVLESPDPEVTYDDLLVLLDDQFEEDVSEAMAEFLFEARVQKHGESVAEWLADLRQLAIPSKFMEGDLSRRLRAQLVRGVADKACQTKLLEATDLDLKKAVSLIKTQMRSKAESAAINKRASHASVSNSQDSVMYVKSECFRCGGSHSPDSCWAKDKTCNTCDAKGHIARKCNRGGGKPHNRNQAGQTGGTRKSKVNCVRAAEQPAGQSAGQGGSAQPVGNQGGGAVAQAARQESTGVQRIEVPGRADSGQAAWEDWGYRITQVRGFMKYPAPDQINLKVEGVDFRVELDNGAPTGLMSEQEFFKHWSEDRLSTDPQKMHMWSGAPIQGPRYCEVTVQVGQQVERLPLIVAKGQGPFIMGRLWLDAFGFRVTGPVQVSRPVYKIIPCAERRPVATPGVVSKDTPEAKDYECFLPGLGTYRGPKMSIKPKPGVKPIALGRRPVPLARRARVEAELKRLTEIGVLTPIDQSDWATPIVVVEKSDGGVRICGDYRDTVNKVLIPEDYPLPTLAEAFAQLHGAQVFSKIDLTAAYNQVLVDEETAMLLALTTHRGLFKVNRLWFGVAVAPPRFQKLIDGLLGGIEGVVVLLDDVLVTGRNMAVHDHHLREVLRRLSEAGLRINPHKSLFRASQVNYLGHVVSAAGIEPLPERVEALMLAPDPQDVDQVRSFLGKVTFYEKFIPSRVDLLAPLYRLLPRDAPWTWGDEQRSAFKAVKEILCCGPLLVHYSLALPLVLCVDASPYGVGAVLAHVIDEFERPVAYASRTMTSAEKNYSQFDKEGLAIVFGVLKFHQYVAGRRFVVYTDHKPLVGLFGGKTPTVTSPRILRWLMTLSAYSFEVKYRPGKEHGNADMLSRLPLPCTVEGEPPQPPVNYVCFLDVNGVRQPDTSPVTADDIAEATGKDAELSQVREWSRSGWPTANPGGELGEYWRKRDQISITQHCLLWGERVIIPRSLRQDAMARLHSPHAGIVRTKAMARVTFWYPGKDQDIERMIASCIVCQRDRPDPPRPKHLSWPRDRPWGRVHLDFGQPTQQEHFLVAVDAETRWIEAWWVPSESSANVIKCLKVAFSRFGDPDLVVSDNGAAFVSEEFTEFLTSRGIRHLTIARECSWVGRESSGSTQESPPALFRHEGGEITRRSRANPICTERGGVDAS